MKKRMNNSSFDELFGETGCSPNTKCERVKKTNKKEKRDRLLLSFFISLIVISFTTVITLLYIENPLSPQSEVAVFGEKDFEIKLVNEIEKTNHLDSFVSKFTNSNYKVKDTGAFGYIYGDDNDGVISLGDDYTYFESGRIVLFDYNEDVRIFWSNYNRKYILFNDSLEYFLVTDSSDFYYRHYLGQHILQDFVDDYLRNKEFIVRADENTWSWEWPFYTPMGELNKHVMQAKITIDLETGYLSEIRLLDEGKEICVFEFSFEEIMDLETDNILEGYERIEEPDVNSRD